MKKQKIPWIERYQAEIKKIMQESNLDYKAAVAKYNQDHKTRRQMRIDEIMGALFAHAKEYKLNVSDLALMIGVSYRTIYRWRKGKSYPTSEAVRDRIGLLLDFKTRDRLGLAD